MREADGLHTRELSCVLPWQTPLPLVQRGPSTHFSFKQNQNRDLSNCGSQPLTLTMARV